MIKHSIVQKRLKQHKLDIFISKDKIEEDEEVIAFTYEEDEYEEFDIILSKSQVSKSAVIELCKYSDIYFKDNNIILLIRNKDYICDEFYNYRCVDVQHTAYEIENMINEFIR